MTTWTPTVAALAAALAVVLVAPPRLPSRAPAVRLAVPSTVRRDPPDLLAWLDALVAELAGGREPTSALVLACAQSGVFPEVAAAARTGGDVPGAFRSVRRTPVAAGVAACWEVSAGSGAGLAVSLASLADSARETERVRRELRTGLAEPRATAVVLALLPVVGLVLGSALGADPLRWLVGAPLGRLVLLAGVALEAAGAAWAWRITRSLEAAL